MVQALVAVTLALLRGLLGLPQFKPSTGGVGAVGANPTALAERGCSVCRELPSELAKNLFHTIGSGEIKELSYKSQGVAASQN